MTPIDWSDPKYHGEKCVVCGRDKATEEAIAKAWFLASGGGAYEGYTAGQVVACEGFCPRHKVAEERDAWRKRAEEADIRIAELTHDRDAWIATAEQLRARANHASLEAMKADKCAEEAEAQLRAICPPCSGEWTVGSGGHRTHTPCSAPATWWHPGDVYAYCDTHKPAGDDLWPVDLWAASERCARIEADRDTWKRRALEAEDDERIANLALTTGRQMVEERDAEIERLRAIVEAGRRFHVGRCVIYKSVDYWTVEDDRAAYVLPSLDEAIAFAKKES